MKVLMQNLAARLRRLSPLTITAIASCCVLPLGVIDHVTPGPMSFVLFYMLVVVLVGWGAGKWHALFVSGVAILVMATVQWGLHRNPPQALWIFLWNNLTRFLLFSIAGWLTAELARLNRNLGRLVEERTGQWKAEAEQHKATSARLAEALERFEQVTNNITEVFWLTDVAKSQMIYISPGYEHIWGRKCEELYREPRSWAAAVHPAERDEVLRRAHTEQAAGSYNVEYRIIRPDGGVRWIWDRAFPVRQKQGEVYRIAGIAEDITERKKTREVLRTQAAILENMAEGVVVTDEQGVILQMNPAGERIWGYARDEAVGQPVSVLSALPGPDSTALMQEVLKALRASGSWRGTFRNRRKDGTIIFCEAVINRVEVQDRVLLVAVEQDVTERVRAQERLQMQASVLESMAEAALLVDEGGTIVLTNPALDALVGYAGGGLAGQPMHLLAGVSLEAHNRAFKETVEQVKTRGTAAGDRLVRRKDGSLIEVEIQNSGVSVGGRFHLVIVGQDITERKKRQEALRQSEATLRVFLDAVPEPAFLLDRDGMILVGNEALSGRLGIPKSELIGKHAFGLIPPEMAEPRKAVFDQVVLSREAARFEDSRGGRHFLNFESPVLDTAGNVIRVAVFAFDITERKRAEEALREAREKLELRVQERTAELQAANQALGEARDNLETRVQERTAELKAANVALRESEERYRSLVNNLNVGVYRNTPGPLGRFVQANPALARMHGYDSVEDFQETRVVDHYREPGERKEFVAELLRQGSVVNYELRLKKKDGTAMYGSVNATAHRGPDGEVDWFDGVLEDISERKRAESLLQTQRDLGVDLSRTSDLDTALRQLLQIAMEMGEVDAGGVYLLNQATGGMDLAVHHGGSPGFVKAVSHWAPDSPQIRLMRQGRPVFTSFRSLPIPHDEARLSEGLRAVALVPLRHDGKAIGALALASHQTDEIPRQTQMVIEAIAAQAAGAIARIRAETERYRLERQILEISDREQARLGQDIHDGLCQQLVSLAFDANSLEGELSRQHRPEAPTARRIARLLDRAITETRQLSRGLFPIRLEAEGLVPALEELVKATRERHPMIGCRLTSQKPVAVENRIIATHLYRIAQEAVTNAIKHSQARRITIGLKVQGNKLELRVEDDGTGIPAKPSESRQGLGLHIMDYRARTIGGTLHVGPGQRGGTLVSCCVPPPAQLNNYPHAPQTTDCP
jgi:PAS domain S-box-containing protein